MNKIYLASDHQGFLLKEKIKIFLEKNNISYEDLGTYSQKSVDYPDFAKKVIKKMQKEKDSKGILICKTGIGMSIFANRFKKIRAALCYEPYSAKMSRLDEDSNILCLKSEKISLEKTKKIISIWLNTKFSKKSRHIRRMKKLNKN